MTDALLSEGDDLRLPTRLVVAPEPGTFRPCPSEGATLEGRAIHPGTRLGTIETLGRSVEVTSAFDGLLVALMASDGERVRASQPVAWLTVTEEVRR